MQKLHGNLVSSLILALPYAGEHCTLDNDACNVQVGSTLSKEQPGETTNLGWLLVSFSNHSQAGLRYSTMRMTRDSLICVYVTLLSRRHTLRDPNRSGLAKIGFEKRRQVQPLDQLMLPPFQLWIRGSPLYEHEAWFLQCPVPSIDGRCRHLPHPRRLTSRSGWHMHYQISQGVPWKTATALDQVAENYDN